MKKIILLLSSFLFFALYISAQQNQKYYYDSGKLQLVKVFDKERNCFHLTEYFESGELLSTKTIVNGRPDGEYIRYYENGTICLFFNWKDQALDGRIYSNYENGQIQNESFFSNKFKSGTWKFYKEDGTLLKEFVYDAEKTPWNSEQDYMTEKKYFHNILAYSIRYEGGKQMDTVIHNPPAYRQLLAMEPSLGEKLFTANCIACHSPNRATAASDLSGISNIRSNEWLHKMITNGEALKKSGDKTAREVYKQSNVQEHPEFKYLSKKEVQSIIDYLRTTDNTNASR